MFQRLLLVVVTPIIITIMVSGDTITRATGLRSGLLGHLPGNIQDSFLLFTEVIIDKPGLALALQEMVSQATMGLEKMGSQLNQFLHFCIPPNFTTGVNRHIGQHKHQP